MALLVVPKTAILRIPMGTGCRDHAGNGAGKDVYGRTSAYAVVKPEIHAEGGHWERQPKQLRYKLFGPSGRSRLYSR
jgi:hypothetical protein